MNGDNGQITNAIYNNDSVLQGSVTLAANGVVGGFFHTADGQATTVNNLSGIFAAVNLSGGVIAQGANTGVIYNRLDLIYRQQ